MRRLVVAALAALLLAFAAFAGYMAGSRGSVDSAEQAVCAEAVAREKELSDMAATAVQKIPPETDYSQREFRGLIQHVARTLYQEKAILVGQNPRCFSPTKRAMAESDNRVWNPTSR